MVEPTSVDPTIAAASTVMLAATTAVMVLVLVFNRGVREGDTP